MSTVALWAAWSGLGLVAWILLGVVIDYMVGNPPRQYNPLWFLVNILSFVSGITAKGLRHRWMLRLAGTLLTLIAVLGVLGLLTAILMVANHFSVWIFRALVVILTYYGVSVRGVSDTALAVYAPLLGSRAEEARFHLAVSLGLDTGSLSSSEMIRTTIETVAESTCEGVVGPLIYGFIGGPAWLWFYKMVTVMTVVLGHRDEKYDGLGWFAAHLDDWANWIPARLTGWMILLAAGMEGRFRHARAVMRTDGRRHPHPKNGITEAAMAGALGVGLGGTNTLGGVVSLRPRIGTPENPLVPRTILHALAISMRATLVFIMGISLISVILTGRWL